jgi:hypothetical protein
MQQELAACAANAACADAGFGAGTVTCDGG